MFMSYLQCYVWSEPRDEVNSRLVTELVWPVTLSGQGQMRVV